MMSRDDVIALLWTLAAGTVWALALILWGLS